MGLLNTLRLQAWRDRASLWVYGLGFGVEKSSAQLHNVGGLND